MPLYYYACPGCGAEVKKIRSPERAGDEVSCRGCGGQMRRSPRGPTTTTKETLDNGLMTRRVERPANAEELYRERSRASGPTRKAGE